MMDKAEYMIMGINDISGNIHNRNLTAEIIGWEGAFVILLACVLNSFQLIKSDSIEYQLLNLGGAGGVFFISLIRRAYQPAALNLIWSVVALIAIVNILILKNY